MDRKDIVAKLDEVRASEGSNRMLAAFFIGVSALEAVGFTEVLATGHHTELSALVGVIGAATLGWGTNGALEAHSDSQTAAALEGALVSLPDEPLAEETSPEAPAE